MNVNESQLREFCSDLEDRIRAGERNVSEDYLNRFDALNKDDDQAIELVYREFTCLEQLGCSPDKRVFLNRFPRLSDKLKKLFEVHEALVEEDLFDDSDWQPGECAAAGQIIDKYKLLQEIGEGGFGIVFMAEQTHPVRRKVAVKVIKPGMDTRDALARFEAERQALALMDHPNISKFLDAGSTAQGRPYFVMELVRGVPITDYCMQQNVLLKQRLELFQVVCLAVQHAHLKGIIHRDLKPSNVMVTLHDARPVPKIIDFGIAKALSQQLTERTLFTRYGQMLGTPMYMSPEQAEMSGLDIDIRSDVYSLGILLYELLTSTPPIDAQRMKTATHADLIRIIAEEDPPTPSTRIATLRKTWFQQGSTRPNSSNPDEVKQKPSGQQRLLSDVTHLPDQIRGDLDQIVMKALEKDRNRRYQTVNDFARDIERYLNDQPVNAASPSMVYRANKFFRRNRLFVGSILAVMLALLIGLAGSTIGFINANRASRRAEAARTDEHKQRLRAEDQERMTAKALARERQHLDKVETNLYFQRIARAHQEWLSNNVSSATQLLAECPESRRGWEWKYLQNIFAKDENASLVQSGHTDSIQCMQVSPDGRSLATCSCEWNAGSKPGEIIIRDIESGKVIREWAGLPGGAWELAFSADGGNLAAVSSNGYGVRVWDVETGDLLMHDNEGSSIYSVTFSSDGLWMATGRPGGRVVVYNTRDFEVAHEFVAGGSAIHSVDFSPDGKFLATLSHRGHIKIWDTARYRLTSEFSGENGNRSVRFSPSGKHVATCGYASLQDGIVTLFEFDNGHVKSIASHRFPFDIITRLRFSPDSQLLGLNGIGSGKFRLIDPFTGSERFSQLAHDKATTDICFVDRGKKLISCGSDRKIRSWHLNRLHDEAVITSDDLAFAKSVDFHPSKNLLAVAGGVNQSNPRRPAYAVSMLRLQDGSYERVTKLSSSGEPFTIVCFSPNGKWIAAGSAAGKLYVWDVSLGRKHLEIQTDCSSIASLCFTSDCQQILSGGANDSIDVRDIDSGVQETCLQGHTDTVSQICAHPDLPLAISSSEDGTVKVWDLDQKLMVQTLTQGQSPCRALTLCHEGKFLATGDDAGNIQLWETAPLEIEPDDRRTRPYRLVGSFYGNGSKIRALAFSPCQSRLASLTDDQRVVVWDVASRQTAIKLTPFGKNIHVFDVAFSSDGEKLVASRANQITIWDAKDASASSRELNAEEKKRWHYQWELECGKSDNLHGALFHLTARLNICRAANTEHHAELFERGIVFAKLGRWTEAKNDFQRCLEQSPKNLNALNHLILLESAIGISPEQTQRFADYPVLAQRSQASPRLADVAAWTIAMHHPTENLAGQAIALSKMSLADSRTPARLNTMGLVLLRSGQYRESIECIEEAMSNSKSKIGQPVDWAVLALAYGKLKDRRAIKWFDKLAWWLEECSCADKNNDLHDHHGYNWNHMLESKLLRDEAATLIRELESHFAGAVSPNQSAEEPQFSTRSSWQSHSKEERIRIAKLAHKFRSYVDENNEFMANVCLKQLLVSRPNELEFIKASGNNSK